MQILIVEDDRPLAQGLKIALRKQGYAVNHVESGKDCLHVVATEDPGIVVLDLGLPDIDGLKVLREIRAKNDSLPVILLTARDSTGDKVAGLDCGADDYLAKPFEMTEFLARLRVLERRLGTSKTNLISLGDVDLDTAAQTVTFQKQHVEFSRREYMLLKSLMENSGKVLTRTTLESKLYSWGEEVCSNALEVHIHHLRKKLGTDFIKTVRGVGYKVDTL
jgi:DNA-binding response OmpR family regulator